MENLNGWSNKATSLLMAHFEPQWEKDVKVAQEVVREYPESLPEELRAIATEIKWNEIYETFQFVPHPFNKFI